MRSGKAPRLRPFFMAWFLWACACSSAYCSVDWYDAQFKQAAQLWLPGWDPLWLKAQCQQESLLVADAVSHAGAIGLCQTMPATFAEEARKLGLDQASPWNPTHSIWVAAAYMARMRSIWKAQRPEPDRRRLSQASYNAGAGNIIKAQRKCNDARHWPEISACLSQVTGPANSRETRTYVQRIEYWYLLFKVMA